MTAMRVSEGEAADPAMKPTGGSRSTWSAGERPSHGFRAAYFGQVGGLTETEVHIAEDLDAGASVSGPAIVAAETTTIVVNPGDTAQVIEGGSLLIDVANGNAQP